MINLIFCQLIPNFVKPTWHCNASLTDLNHCMVWKIKWSLGEINYVWSDLDCMFALTCFCLLNIFWPSSLPNQSYIVLCFICVNFIKWYLPQYFYTIQVWPGRIYVRLFMLPPPCFHLHTYILYMCDYNEFM